MSLVRIPLLLAALVVAAVSVAPAPSCKSEKTKTCCGATCQCPVEAAKNGIQQIPCHLAAGSALSAPEIAVGAEVEPLAQPLVQWAAPSHPELRSFFSRDLIQKTRPPGTLVWLASVVLLT